MSTLIKSTAAVGSMTLLSRVLGLARDIVIARFFSASDAADAFFVAFKIPNFLRRLFAEGAFSLAFVPVLTEYRNNYTAAQTRDLIDRVAGTLGLILLLLSLAGVAASPVLVSIIAAGFIDQPVKFQLTADMLRITFPYILLISMTAMAGGILNTLKRFAVAGIHPGIAQPEHDWLCAVVESASRRADYRISLGGVNRRHRAIIVSTALPLSRGSITTPEMGLAARRRAKNHQVDDPRVVRLLGGADQSVIRYLYRILPGYRQRRLAILL